MTLSAPAARHTIARLQTDPVFFCRHILNVTPWAKQAAILEALRDHDRVAVRSGHGTGKSFISACAALWFLYAFHPAKVITTAPTWAQVRMILWSELRALHQRARIPLGGRVLEERVKVADDAFAVGLSTDEADRFQGFHAERVLVILDEAPGVREDIWEAAETLLTGAVGKLLAIGNPTRPAGLFHECFRPGSRWRTVHISCLDSPNAAAGGNGESAALPYPRLVTRRWIDARAAEWGEDSPLFRARVLGEFPRDESSVLCPQAWLERAAASGGRTTAIALDAPGEPVGAWRLGVDVARQGADATVFCLRDDAGARALETRRGWDTMRTAGRVAQLLNTLPLRPEHVYVDDTGLGAGVTDRLREQGHAVTAVLAAQRASDPQRFVNQRAESYWRLRDALRPPPEPAASGFALPADAGELLRELGALTFSLASDGRIRIADKVALRGLLGGSPDHADALALTFASDDGDDDGPRMTILGSPPAGRCLSITLGG